MKRALLIGINYAGTDSALNGCINDISNINKFLLENVSGYSKDSITVLTDDHKSVLKPTKQNMESNIKKFVTGCKSGDTLFFYYSGHGSQLSDNNGDESDGKDSVLVPADYKTSGVIRDDWLFANMVNCLPAGVLLWTFTDCCHSGTMLDLQFNLQSNSTYKNGQINKAIKYNGSEWSNQFGLTNEKSKTSQADAFTFSGCFFALSINDDLPKSTIIFSVPGEINVLLVFILPIIDTTSVFINRIARKQSPFVGGKDHTTHHLSFFGFNNTQIIFIFSGIAFLSSLMSIIIYRFVDYWSYLYVTLYGIYILAIFVTLYLTTQQHKELRK